MNDKEKRFLEQSSKWLDDSLDSLDAVTLSRLNQARQKALRHYTGGRRIGWLFTPLATASLVAGFAVAAIALVLWTAVPQTFRQQQDFAQWQQYEDMDILVSETDLDLLEDLEFIGWLVEENPADGVEFDNAG